MLSNCGAVVDFWKSLGQQGDQTNQSQRKPSLNIHWKDWCWSWSSNTLATWCKDLTHWERHWCWERLRMGDKGETEDNVDVHSCHLLFDHFQFTLIHGLNIPGSYTILFFIAILDGWMVGWCHWLNGHEFEQTPGYGERQGSLVCCSLWDRK